MAYFKDLREYIAFLEKQNLLWQINKQVKLETELMPLVKWQFRGLSEDERRAFLFKDIVDVKGRKYDMPVLVAAYAASRKIYAAGMMCKPDEIGKKWSEALIKPIPPKLVSSGAAVQEEVISGKKLEEVGLDEFPFTIDVPGFDGLRRTTATHVFSRDPETGAVNIGNYSGHIHARDRITIGIGRHQHMWTHMEKAKKLGKPLEVAIVVGVIPAIAMVSVAKIAYGHDELAVAGGIAGEKIEVVKCKTVNVEVPARAEIVIEGTIDLEYMESQTGSFGEYSGYMAEPHLCPILHVSCITHRNKPIFVNMISQMPPSESSKIRQIAAEGNYFKFLKHDVGVDGVQEVAVYESSGSRNFVVIQMSKTHDYQVWQALNALSAYQENAGKIIVAVDTDIDPRDADSVIWAMSFRMQPHRDTRIVLGKIASLDPSSAPPGTPLAEMNYPKPSGASTILINATNKWEVTPVALPRKEYMEEAKKIWESLSLPTLKPRKPWFGYELGYWPKEYAESAEMNLKGKIYELGEGTWKAKKPAKF